MIKGGGKKVEAILKRQSHYREEAAIAPSESMPPSGHGWGAQTAACCQHRLRALPETSHSSAPGGLWGHRAAPALSHRRRYFIPEAHGWMAEQQLGKGSDAHTHTHTPQALLCPHTGTICCFHPRASRHHQRTKVGPHPQQPMHSKAPLFLALLNSTRALLTFQIGSESRRGSFRNLWHPGWMPDPKTQTLCGN